MFTWTKLGRIFDPTAIAGNSWIKEFAQSPSALVFDDFVRVYFSARPLPDGNGQYKSYLAYVDLDRKNLHSIVGICEKPILDLGGLGTFDEFGMNPATAIRAGDEVRIYYAGWTRCESVPFNAAIGMAVSKDNGKTFNRLGDGPVLSYTPSEPFVIGSPRIRRFNDKWRLFYVAGKKWVTGHGRPEPVYKIRMASSDDGVNWIKHGEDLVANKLEENECQASPEVFFLDGKYHMLFSYRYNLGFKNKENGYRIGYACSTDLIAWERDDGNAGIDVSPDGWDAEMVSYPNVFELDGVIHMLYQGNQVGKYGFGLAKLEQRAGWGMKK